MSCTYYKLIQKKYYKKFLPVLKKCYYEYISKGLHTTFGIGIWKGERFGFTPPPQCFSIFPKMICLFRYVCGASCLTYPGRVYWCDTWRVMDCGTCTICYTILHDTMRRGWHVIRCDVCCAALSAACTCLVSDMMRICVLRCTIAC